MDSEDIGRFTRLACGLKSRARVQFTLETHEISAILLHVRNAFSSFPARVILNSMRKKVPTYLFKDNLNRVQDK